MNDLQVHWWPIDKVIPYARNSRKVPERTDKVAASIREFGWSHMMSEMWFGVNCPATMLPTPKTHDAVPRTSILQRAHYV